MRYNQVMALDFAAHIVRLGFRAFMAESNEYGFVTDAVGKRVMCFSFSGCDANLGGNYFPASHESGTGWRMDKCPSDLRTAKDVHDALYAYPPAFVGCGWKTFTTLQQHLAMYGSSSKYREIWPMPNDNYQQNPDHIAKARGQHVAALALFDKGFTAKVHQQDAIDLLNRAYDVLVKEALDFALWSRRTRAADDSKWLWDDEADHQFYIKNNVPDLHVWNKDKHPALWAKYATPATIKIANVLRADRDAIKAAPINKKPPSKTTIMETERLAKAKTCQICGRPVMAERGNIAHHGYTRPEGWGYQTASCYGAIHPPFEVSRLRLAEYLKLLRKQMAGLHQHMGEAIEETIALRVHYTGKNYVGMNQEKLSFLCNRNTFADSLSKAQAEAKWPRDLPASFDVVKQHEIKSTERKIDELTVYIKRHQARYDAWKPVEEKVA